MKHVDDIMNIERKSKNTIHCLDRQFTGLGSEEIIHLGKNSEEFSHLESCVNNFRGATHKTVFVVGNIIRIRRQEDFKRFNDSVFHKMESDRCLLWHGLRVTNYAGILSHGLLIAPCESPMSGYMLGKGIYVAEMSSKSASSCHHTKPGGEGLLLLCEAELGTPRQMLTVANHKAGGGAKEQGMHSTRCLGRVVPSEWVDAGIVHKDPKGC
ncbi:Acetoacetyl-CoA synthetase [Fusarium oxysporum f. sp. albedinis]|nr:Acetoacetyl-CoA synthetase [Fusarium oxysporum f. sp. albedinis]